MAELFWWIISCLIFVFIWVNRGHLYIDTSPESPFIDYLVSLDGTSVSTEWDWDNETGIMSLTFYDKYNRTESMRMEVFKDSLKGIIEVCNETAYGNQGRIECDTSDYDQGTLFSRAYRKEVE